ncbi:hypothetical protein DV515_00018660 [Chloebia gouldiae]|uniref:Uncharacterized protein n=1 Tax=Chloebia gouldiae TaxID=44316 RepID=A0A3L8Q752_CHLGU|nr:hypothetical protein DV515_00018660 [Chloebia gouldiae]
MSLSPSQPSPLRSSAASARQGNSSPGCVWKREMEQTPKYIFLDLSLEGSRAAGRAAAGTRRDLGGCTHRGDPRWGGGAGPLSGGSQGVGAALLEPHPQSWGCCEGRGSPGWC